MPTGVSELYIASNASNKPLTLRPQVAFLTMITLELMHNNEAKMNACGGVVRLKVGREAWGVQGFTEAHGYNVCSLFHPTLPYSYNKIRNENREQKQDTEQERVGVVGWTLASLDGRGGALMLVLPATPLSLTASLPTLSGAVGLRCFPAFRPLFYPS